MCILLASVIYVSTSKCKCLFYVWIYYWQGSLVFGYYQGFLYVWNVCAYIWMWIAYLCIHIFMRLYIWVYIVYMHLCYLCLRHLLLNSSVQSICYFKVINCLVFSSFSPSFSSTFFLVIFFSLLLLSFSSFLLFFPVFLLFKLIFLITFLLSSLCLHWIVSN